jgi:hypothetical protein
VTVQCVGSFEFANQVIRDPVGLTALAAIQPLESVQSLDPNYWWPACVFHDIIKQYNTDIPHADGRDSVGARGPDALRMVSPFHLSQLHKRLRRMLFATPPSLLAGLALPEHHRTFPRLEPVEDVATPTMTSSDDLGLAPGHEFARIKVGHAPVAIQTLAIASTLATS